MITKERYKKILEELTDNILFLNKIKKEAEGKSDNNVFKMKITLLNYQANSYFNIINNINEENFIENNYLFNQIDTFNQLVNGLKL